MPLIIGTYTEASHQGIGQGVCLADFNKETGAVTLTASYSGIPNPSYLALGEGRIYAASELKPKGQIAALSLSGESIEELWRTDAGGAATCHISLSPDNRTVAAANYVSGTAKLLSAADGTTLEDWAYQGSGPNEKRQERPHAHQAIFSPGGHWLLVTDLGSDKIWLHATGTDKSTGAPGQAISLPSGSGPRHSLFHPELPVLYTVAELNGQVYWGQWDEESGRCEWQGDVSIQPAGSDVPPHSSAIKLHPTLPLLYAADRATGQIAVFTIDAKGGLSLSDHIAVTGAGPRDFALSLDGAWLIIACQGSNEILSIPLDAETGLPKDEATRSDFGSPVCLVFAEII